MPTNADPTNGLVRQATTVGVIDVGAVRPAASAHPAHARLAALQRFWRYRWSLLAVFALVAGGGAALVWTQVQPEYRAEATVRVSPIIPRLVYRTEDNGMIPLYQSYLNTQVSIMGSSKLLERVLDRRDVQATSWYRDRGATNVEHLAKATSVSQLRRTELIDVAMITREPRDAATIVNAIVEEYVKLVNETSRQDDDEIYQKLSEQYKALHGEIRGLENTAAELRKRLGTGTPDEMLSDRAATLYAMQGQLEELQRQLALTEWQLGQFESGAAAPSSQPTLNTVYEKDAEWRNRQRELTVARHQVEIERDRLGEEHPKMKELRQRVSLAETNLRERERQLDLYGTAAAVATVEPGATPVPLNLREQYELLKRRAELLAQDVARQQAEFTNVLDSAELLKKHNDELTHKREMYEAVRSRKSEKETEARVPGSIKILSTAYPPAQPFRDRRAMFTGLAVVAGLGVSIGLAYLRLSFAQAIQTSEDAWRTVHAPLLGELPLMLAGDPPALEQNQIHAESIRIVRTALLHLINRQQGSAFCITSAGPRVGKTTVSVLLAKSLALAGKRVLLVDADLRNSNVARRLKLEAGPGLLQVLGGQADEKAILRNIVPRLDVLPAGRLDGPLDPEVLAGPVLADAMRRWRAAYDVVLIDSPPIMPVADARILAPLVDGTIMVVREGYCLRAEVAESLASLDVAGGRTIGTVFIGSAWRQGYRSRYGGYYGSGGGDTALALDARRG